MFPDAKDQIIAYAVNNLAKLTIEGLYDFIVSKVLPRLVSIWLKDVAVSSTDAAGTEEHHHDSNNNYVVEDNNKYYNLSKFP